MCSWLPERPWCLMQFSCPVVSIRIDFQRGVLKDMERLKASVLLDGTCRVPLENHTVNLLRRARKHAVSLICLSRKSHGQPTAPRSKKHTVSFMRARLRRLLCAPVPACAGPYAFPLTLTLSRLRRLLCAPVPASADPYAFPPAPVLTRSADPLRFPTCAGPYVFPLAPDRFSFLNDLFFPFIIRSIELISVEAVFSAIGYDH